MLAGETLLAERDIASDLGVSRTIVRKAIDGLVKDGLLNRRHGAGTFVSSRNTRERGGVVIIDGEATQ